MDFASCATDLKRKTDSLVHVNPVFTMGSDPLARMV